MKRIKTFLIDSCDFLFEKYGFEIVDESNTNTNGGAEIVELKNSQLDLVFTYDRGVMNLAVRSNLIGSDLYSIWYLMELITGDSDFWRYDFAKFPNQIPSVNERKYLDRIKENFADLYDLFSEQNVCETIVRSNELVKNISRARSLKT